MVTSTSGRELYLTELSNGTAAIQADVTPDKGGSGKHFRPHDLIEAGYAACLNITARMVLDRLNLPYDEVRVTVELDRKEEATAFHYRIDISGELEEASKQMVLRLVRECPVYKTLSKPLEFRMV
ncbi:OsmC family protein [Paenibacillus sp. XY044]|uniref:OsmC family protein n=1 Tax=Paenibacillus sp. XY044 TaxID=2026089 RepID=UPI000B98DA10|nr:OsmC family protein [Paenibacillus sp. XY044]OZB90457.1 stress protein [Paenibacillus sp. XY044]